MKDRILSLLCRIRTAVAGAAIVPIVMAGVAFPITAMAGAATTTYPLIINTTDRTASGSLKSVKRSSEETEEIECAVSLDAVSCSAIKGNTNAFCSTSLPAHSAQFVDLGQMVNESSFIQFKWESVREPHPAGGVIIYDKCMEITVRNSSRHLP